jgi:nucleoside-diphosphate-sugar epimerase
VLVTGGSGKLGRAVVSDLTTNGWRVISVDRVPHLDPAVRSVVADLRDLGQTFEMMTGVDSRFRRLDAIVHLAATPAPGINTNATIFENNLMTTHNIFTAATKVGVDIIVWASSETLLGIPFTTPPPYLPVDELYEARPESSYSLAKHLEESMAAQFSRWNPQMSFTALRLSNVLDESDYASLHDHQDDSSRRRWNLWGYIDPRDGAQAVRKALERETGGFEVYVIANADTVMNQSTADLVAQEFPGVTVTREFTEHETLLSIDKARRELGFEPRFSWRDGTP